MSDDSRNTCIDPTYNRTIQKLTMVKPLEADSEEIEEGTTIASRALSNIEKESYL